MRSAAAGSPRWCIGSLSEWCSSAFVGPLRQIAISIASVTSCAVICELIDQPTTRRENRSRTTATYNQPSVVQMYVKSAAHLRFGSVASTRRSSTFGAIVCSMRVPDQTAAGAVWDALPAAQYASNARSGERRSDGPSRADPVSHAVRRRSDRSRQNLCGSPRSISHRPALVRSLDAFSMRKIRHGSPQELGTATPRARSAGTLRSPRTSRWVLDEEPNGFF